jgi:putative Holliday junction resolvase
VPVVSLAELSTLVPTGGRLLGLDIGSKRVGLAFSDETRTLATADRVLERARYADDLARLAALCRERHVGGIVVGLPVSMDGREGPQCQRVRQFARDLLLRIDVPLAFWDERLSTAAVDRMLIREVDMSRKRRRGVVDQVAAAYILQGALDAMHVQRHSLRTAGDKA